MCRMNARIRYAICLIFPVAVDWMLLASFVFVVSYEVDDLFLFTCAKHSEVKCFFIAAGQILID